MRVLLFDLLVLLLFGATAALAVRKGYSGWRWALASGLIGLIALAALPDTRRPREGIDRADLGRLRREGDSLGTALSALFVILMTLRYLHRR
jgi:hypothetical protein